LLEQVVCECVSEREGKSMRECLLYESVRSDNG
jgi:hypothetical protein